MAVCFPQPHERMEEAMSLLNDFARPCVLMEKTRVEDGEGGYTLDWKDGVSFQNYQALDTSMEARRAETEGVTSVYSALVWMDSTAFLPPEPALSTAICPT